ncbi:MAG TPA: DNA internalization-related competence protein ComEC/Rec2 [Candidatus Udaeobacter sp.]|jgi:competence protein ComEC|nr:DNA internalization-related competence protein ComEC/Rec2 [Candidatus Udaeobacter sp.]
MGGRSAVGLALALWGGLLVGERMHDVVLGASAIVAALAAGVAGIRARRGTAAAALITMAFLLAGAARGSAFHACLERESAALGAEDTFWLDGTIDSPPALESGAPLVTLAIDAARPPLIEGSRVRLRLPDDCAVEWGDHALLLARLSRLEPPRNPGGFDSRGAGRAVGVIASGFAPYARIEPARGLEAWPRATVMRWRRAVERRLHRGLTPETAELVVPLVFGDRSAIDTDLDAAFRSAGLTHLLALSGLHVVWLAGIARGLAAALGAGVVGRALARGACGALYLMLAGPIPSLARASAGEMLGALARLTQRAVDPLQALAISVLVLLMMNPGWAADLGFQLSCAATVGLVTAGSALSAIGGRLRPLARAFGPTAGAQLLSLPLLIARFHAVAWTAGVSNLLAVPVTGLLLMSAWIGALAELALPGAGASFLHACEPLALALRLIVETAHRIPGALLTTGPSPAPAWLAAAGAVLLAAALSPGRSLEERARGRSPRAGTALILASALTLSGLILIFFARPIAPRRGHVWVVVLDVGQGDAIAIGAPRGWCQLDAGPRTPRTDAGQSVVLPFLRWAAVRRLDALMLTHDDGDHTGGARAILAGTRVAEVMAPGPRTGVPGPLARFRGRPLALGEVLENDPLMIVRWPPRADSATGFWERPVTSADNGAALVIEVGAGRGRALLAADADSAVEAALDLTPGIALLKVAHHGSASSSGAVFLRRIRPVVAAISVGARNRFGHPAPETLERLRAAGATVLRTDQKGALWFDLSTEGVRMIEWRRASWRREPAAVSIARTAPRE